MTLYTVEVAGDPVVVLAAGIVPPPPKEMASDPKFLAAQAATERIIARIKDEAQKRLGISAAEFSRVLEIREIDEALDAWLADELVMRGGWDGDRDQIHIRPATDAEKLAWRAFAAREIADGLPAEDEHDTVLFFENRNAP